jgi:hypothetical protein
MNPSSTANNEEEEIFEGPFFSDIGLQAMMNNAKAVSEK